MNFRAMNVRAQLGLLRRQLLSSAYSRRVWLKSGDPIVSFTFDDFPRTALTVGGRILKSQRARGTYYAAVGLMNQSNELGEQFRREDLDTLLGEGHEVASHTFSHVSCRSTSISKFKEEVEQGRRAIQEFTGLSDSGNFAFPFGEVTLNAKRAIGMDLVSCRGIWPGWNGPGVDLNLLRANSLYGDYSRCAEVEQLILENERRRSWLIFYTHDVQPTPSRFGCTPELLEAAVSFASDRGARILTVAEVVAELVSFPAGAESCSASGHDPAELTRR
ncbi:MAG: polysaccharide deacetylase family protein [Candidatus Sulfotelmatobacter sp.]